MALGEPHDSQEAEKREEPRRQIIPSRGTIPVTHLQPRPSNDTPNYELTVGRSTDECHSSMSQTPSKSPTSENMRLEGILELNHNILYKNEWKQLE